MCHKSYLIVSVNVVNFVGARTDIANNNGDTPLQRAEYWLAKYKSDPDTRKPYEKV